MKKYPLYYYLILLIAFIFSAIFWIFVFSKSINSIESNHSSIDESIYILKPIDKDKIILPINENKEPDYNYMEEYSKSIIDSKTKKEDGTFKKEPKTFINPQSGTTHILTKAKDFNILKLV